MQRTEPGSKHLFSEPGIIGIGFLGGNGSCRMEEHVDTLIVDPHISEPLIEERRARGADRFDEVWQGTYIMAPAPNDEHQDVVGGLIEVFRTVVDRRGLGKTRPAINLAADPEQWERDYRVPDLVVFLTGSTAVCHGVFWSGPPDFLVEITSPFDKTRDKLDFYSRLRVRELLIVDRDPWQLELHRLERGSLVRVANTTPVDSASLTSDVLPLQFQLIRGDARPIIEIAATDLKRSWTV
jgi:Uma2 family endonuclease